MSTNKPVVVTVCFLVEASDPTDAWIKATGHKVKVSEVANVDMDINQWSNSKMTKWTEQYEGLIGDRVGIFRNPAFGTLDGRKDL